MRVGGDLNLRYCVCLFFNFYFYRMCFNNRGREYREALQSYKKLTYSTLTLASKKLNFDSFKPTTDFYSIVTNKHLKQLTRLTKNILIFSPINIINKSRTQDVHFMYFVFVCGDAAQPQLSISILQRLMLLMFLTHQRRRS